MTRQTITAFISIGFAAALMSMTTGCATVTRGWTQSVKFTSDPAGATLTVDGKQYTTPAEVRINRKAEHDVTVAQTGYQPVHFKIKGHWDGYSVVGNAAMPGGSVGFVVDTLDGADHSIDDVPPIKLTAATGADLTPVEMFVYKGKLLDKTAYDAAVAADTPASTGKNAIVCTDNSYLPND